ncbi:flagellar basal body-associated FliL family protein [Flaviflexus massiliensis]|uniref:hypothetical protein n=1 Tax=Flaviflexus massiliensis TaxID=1522309 RepID=UPI0006D57813|nr:hypothetical protein [Flaviflexus massiliensis]
MSENYGGRRPENESNRPEQGGDQGQYGGQGAGSAHEAPQQWGGQDTQSFQASSGPEAGQNPYNPNSTQQFQAQGYGQGETQAFGVNQYGQGQNYNTQQYNQQGYGQQNSQNQYGGGYGQQPATYPPSQGQPQYGQGHYGDGYGGQPPYDEGGYGQPPKKGKGPLIAWIVLGVILLAAAVVGILFATGVIGGDDSEEESSGTETTQSQDPSSDPSGHSVPQVPSLGPDTSGNETTDPSGDDGSYGSDPEMDALYDACGGGDMAACDDLYFSSGLGTEYEEFGNTCGGTESGNQYGMCDWGDITGGDTGTDSGTDTAGEKPAKQDVIDGMAVILEDYGVTVEMVEAAGISGEQLNSYYTCIVDEVYDVVSPATLESIANQQDQMAFEDQTAFNDAVTACQGELLP